MIRPARSALFLLVGSAFVVACGSDSNGPSGPQATVVKSDVTDFMVCRDTIGTHGLDAVNEIARVGNAEIGDTLTFLAGECRAVLMFPSAGLNVIPDPNAIDSVRLEVFVTGSEPWNPPSGDIVVESIEWTGDMADAFEAINMSTDVVTFSPSTGGYILNAAGLPLLEGPDGMMAFRLRMAAPDPLDGATHAWRIGMADGPPATVAALTFYWTP